MEIRQLSNNEKHSSSPSALSDNGVRRCPWGRAASLLELCAEARRVWLAKRDFEKPPMRLSPTVTAGRCPQNSESVTSASNPWWPRAGILESLKDARVALRPVDNITLHFPKFYWSRVFWKSACKDAPKKRIPWTNTFGKSCMPHSSSKGPAACRRL